MQNPRPANVLHMAASALCSLSVKAYELPLRAASGLARWVGWFVRSRACPVQDDRALCSSTCLHLLSLQTHNAVMRLKRTAPQCSRLFKSVAWADCDLEHTVFSLYKTNKQKPYQKFPNNSQIGYHYQDLIHCFQTLWHILSMAPEKTTQYLSAFHFTLSLCSISQGFAPLL